MKLHVCPLDFRASNWRMEDCQEMPLNASVLPHDYPLVIKHGPFISDFPSKKTPFSSGIFQQTMHDDQKAQKISYIPITHIYI